jgi:hypothetical protein
VLKRQKITASAVVVFLTVILAVFFSYLIAVRVEDSRILLTCLLIYVAAGLIYVVIAYWSIADIYVIDRRLAFPIDVKDKELRARTMGFKIIDSMPFPFTLVSLVILRSVMFPEGPLAYFSRLPSMGTIGYVPNDALMGIMTANIAYVFILNNVIESIKIAKYRRWIHKHEQTEIGVIESVGKRIFTTARRFMKKESYRIKKDVRMFFLYTERMHERIAQSARITVPIGFKSAVMKIFLVAGVSIFL